MESMEALSKRLALAQRSTVYGYVRVSTEGQEDNQSLAMQRDAIEKYCADKKLEPPQFVEEVASAAKPLWVVNLPGTPADDAQGQSAPRPRLLFLLTHLRAVRDTMGKNAKLHLIVWRLDRLARVDYEQELFITMFQRDGIMLHSVMPTEDHMLDGGHVRDPARAFTRTVLAAASAYERAMIELRMTSGMAYKAAQGGYTGGVPPFGYIAKNAELVIEPFEAQMVIFIFHLRKRYNMSMRQIETYLTKAKSPEDKTLYSRQKIKRMLDNEKLYRGHYTDRYGAVHFRPDLRILPDDPEALLDYQTQPQRAESIRLSDPHHHATADGAGHDHRDDGSARHDGSQEPGQS